MKKTLAFLLAFVSLFACVACKPKQEKEEPQGVVVTGGNASPTEGYELTTEIGAAKDYVIVIRNDATKAEEYAARWMSNSIYEVTGVSVATQNEKTNFSDNRVISIGQTKQFIENGFKVDKEELNGDGFIVKSVGDDLFISGATDSGTIYGVLDVVEYMLGVKFLTADDTYYPKSPEAKLYKADRVSVPAFRYRTFLEPDVYDNVKKDYFVARRYKSDYITLSEEYGGNLEMRKDIAPGQETHNSLGFINWDEVLVNGSIPKEYMHAFSNDGHQILSGVTSHAYSKYATDICFTDGINDDGTYEETVTVDGVTTKTAIQLMIEGFKRIVLNDAYEGIYYLVGQQDIEWRPCGCARCLEMVQKYGEGGIMVRFFNILSDKIDEWKESGELTRDIYVVMFAYLYTQPAPVVSDGKGGYVPIDETVEVHKNIVVRLAPYGQDVLYLYDDPKQDEVGDDSQFLQKWEAITDKFMIWSYHKQYFYYYLYFPTMQNWTTNFKQLQKMGLVYNFMQSNFQESTYQSKLESYVASKMMWNPDLNYLELVSEFNYYYFGEDAYEYINAYYDMISGAYIRAMQNPAFTTTKRNFITNGTVFTKGVLYGCITLFEDAIKAVEESDVPVTEKRVYLERLNKSMLMPRYSLLVNAQNLGYSQIEINTMAQQFIADVLSYGGAYYGTGGGKLDLDNLKYQP